MIDSELKQVLIEFNRLAVLRELKGVESSLKVFESAIDRPQGNNVFHMLLPFYVSLDERRSQLQGELIELKADLKELEKASGYDKQ